jgi:hypothetical protein
MKTKAELVEEFKTILDSSAEKDLLFQEWARTHVFTPEEREETLETLYRGRSVDAK